MAEDESVLGKRIRDEAAAQQDNGQDNANDSDSDDVGPMPLPAGAAGTAKKKRKVLPHEKLYLEHLPNTEQYYKSFMHRDVLNFVVMTKTEFLITTSVDGHLKLWKKQEEGIEFVKHYRAHLNPVVSVSASADGQLFATVSEDQTAKVFDVVNFDMINIIKLGYTPLACCWVHKSGQAQGILAISEAGSGKIRLYDGRGNETPLETIDSVHRFPVHVMTYSDRYHTVISADEAGFVEYWQPIEPFVQPKNVPGLWQYKSETDLYEFKKSKSTPTCITLSPNSSSFVTFSLPDRQVRIFSFLSGKLTRKYDESLEAIQEMQQAGTAVYRVEDMEFGRRLAAERELELPGPDGKIPGRWINAVWDESGAFIIYPTLLGIKGMCVGVVCCAIGLDDADFFGVVVNTYTNRVARLLGKDEVVRFLNLTLYQGAPSKKSLTTVVRSFLSSSTSGIPHSLPGNGCIRQPNPSRERPTRSHSHLHRFQEEQVLHVHALRTRGQQNRRPRRLQRAPHARRAHRGRRNGQHPRRALALRQRRHDPHHPGRHPHPALPATGTQGC
ncbi:peptidyl-prolyl cis-trans isomerase, variant 2 [Coprinopsis cinerea AmutBmut pab1-1]|nr:peptidyl-prolyl cis-trans isomerase, variant 2 [Coprinopsis cinerea AmutBmut pab1-1]